MYSTRSATFRQSQFDQQCARFVNEVFAYSNALSLGLPCQCDIANNRALLIDYLDTALINGSSNTALEDLVLDKIIVMK